MNVEMAIAPKIREESKIDENAPALTKFYAPKTFKPSERKNAPYALTNENMLSPRSLSGTRLLISVRLESLYVCRRKLSLPKTHTLDAVQTANSISI